MCGITGIFHFDNSRHVNKSLLKRMTNIVHHRGPDGEGFYINGNIGFGHRRLSIIDLSTGDQPMFNVDKTISLVLNGEIYNYVELKEELKSLGHSFRTLSDTEVIIKAYEQWGTDCQNKFNGMWAFALWDECKQQLFISRDRIGEKPLHYALWDNTVLFASEMKSIFEYGLPKEPLFEFLEIYSVLKNIPAPYTFFKNIKKLLPGHYLVVNNSGINEYKYWDLPEIDENNMYCNKKRIYSEFSSLFHDAVKIRMRSDVPFGAFLSGGLDSSSIVALMSEYSSFPVKTFTIGYEENEYDESRLARLVANKFSTDHFVEKIDHTSFYDSLKKVAFHYDEPFGDSSAIPTGCVSKFAAEHVKMVLTGDGGDEVLSGYSSYQGIKFAQIYKALPNIFQELIPFNISIIKRITSGSIRYKLNRYQHLLKTSSQKFNTRVLDKRAKPDLDSVRLLMNNEIKTWSVIEYLNEFMKKCKYKDDFYKLMYLNFKHDLPNDYLVKVDRMSMAYSLETRLPFLDYKLIEFMVKVDKSIKMQGWERKSILKNTIAKKLPRELFNAPKKGFRVPVREWFKTDELKDHLNQMGCINYLFNKVEFDKIVNDNRNGLHDHGNLLWSLIVLNELISC
ncbi:MAG: asparagine synthase (glutamine-hydrolyzing) [Melioribacteraceae bacterium]|nr:asparagine synthase (glutamine-hydrolyzing) [Melioribacteraceae bacterium]